MTRIVLHTALSTIAALTLAVSGPSYAADGDTKGKIKTFELVAPKAGRDIAKPPVARILPPKTGRVDTASGSGGGTPSTLFSLTPKAPRAGIGSGSGPSTAQFVAPKAKKTGSGDAITAKFVAPKAKKTGSGDTITAKFVAPKAKKTETQVFAKAETPSKALLLAPATSSAIVEADQAAPAPKVLAEATPEATVTPDAGELEAKAREIALAHLRAAQRYGYGAYEVSYESSTGYGDYDESAYENEDYGQDYSDENCW
jgi:hypothetical protein